ncbi:hypothetical protein CSOJ01_08549 [Colletotrichum sojae]|uniref:Uncharacterized protein n=1 Tax=Colletotrichum sojae TaxID=2175907 RepID=A0A8H6MRX4_9PEZI|nr:hypothetical protein CSOJ01_08549 [Colletotrichum sojae]
MASLDRDKRLPLLLDVPAGPSPNTPVNDRTSPVSRCLGGRLKPPLPPKLLPKCSSASLQHSKAQDPRSPRRSPPKQTLVVGVMTRPVDPTLVPGAVARYANQL